MYCSPLFTCRTCGAIFTLISSWKRVSFVWLTAYTGSGTDTPSPRNKCVPCAFHLEQVCKLPNQYLTGPKWQVHYSESRTGTFHESKVGLYCNKCLTEWGLQNEMFLHSENILIHNDYHYVNTESVESVGTYGNSKCCQTLGMESGLEWNQLVLEWNRWIVESNQWVWNGMEFSTLEGQILISRFFSAVKVRCV